MSHSIVIVEDEPPARSKLERFIEGLDDFRVTGQADSVESALAIIRAERPAVVFLDIRLGTRSGFDVLDGLRGCAAPLVVFTTAYSEYAVRAFEVQALDYLLKPYDEERFLQCVARIRAALAEPDRGDFEERMRRLLAGMPDRRPQPRQILVRSGERAFFLDVADIQRVSAAGNYVEVHAGGKTHLIRESLADFVSQLDASEFLRVHRSHVVRVGFIAELRPLFHGDYELVLHDGQRVALSRRYKQLLPAAIRRRL